VNTDATNYARLLRKMLVGSPAPLRIASLLGSSNYQTCTLTGSPCNAAYSPTDEDWHYALGHWVEDDAATVAAGNVAYSSAGAFGFYPWVNQARNLYGILAREETGGTQEGFASARCGQLIRLAYVTGVAQ
jgi:CubicO group peptidase (beta-lactamase class C family)